jgi:hypothetical protein
MTAVVRRLLAGGAVAAALASGALVVVQPAPGAAQAAAATKTFANEKYRYSVALPAGCRHEVGPGTVDAVCSADFDPERSAQVSSTAALVMEVGAENVAADAGKTAADLGRTFDETAFRDELPETVCGESEKTRVRIENVKQSVQDVRIVYAADVTCAAVKFLQIGERRAAVQYIIGADARYRLVARAPKDDFAMHKQAIDAFFDSFSVLPAGK